MPSQSTSQMILVPQRKGYDYSLLDASVAEQVQAAALYIHVRVGAAIEAIVYIGLQLHCVKESLRHGQFVAWVKGEFDWTPRTANNYMSVADWLGDKQEIVSHMRIVATAAYMLSASSTSQTAREMALERAKAGEEITNAIAREIVELTRSQNGQRRKGKPAHRLRAELRRLLDQSKKSLSAVARTDFAREFREAAAALEETELETEKQPPQ